MKSYYSVCIRQYLMISLPLRHGSKLMEDGAYIDLCIP